MKPLFKYTGGKYKEYLHIKELMPPTINNYYEPFVGGGGVMFRLKEDDRIKGKIFINDFSESLTDFYKCIGKEEFKLELEKISAAWNAIKEFSEAFAEKHNDRFFDFILGKITDKNFVTDEMKAEISDFDLEYNTHGFDLSQKIVASLNDKAKRFSKKEISENETDVPFKNMTTSICQAFYFIVRDMYNDWNNSGHILFYSIYERSAQWLFIREYCFGSMFRFDSNGNFNIPYGGFSYNSKCFDCKIEKILSDEAKFLATDVTTTCYDFEKAIKTAKFEENDFMFLDPPYDSTFSDYDGNSFTKEDHIRLAETLKDVTCKWMMAIGKTDFIADLYKNFHVLEYDKTYMYQARGDYDNKHTTHLLITNYNTEDLLFHEL